MNLELQYEQGLLFPPTIQLFAPTISQNLREPVGTLSAKIGSRESKRQKQEEQLNDLKKLITRKQPFFPYLLRLEIISYTKFIIWIKFFCNNN